MSESEDESPEFEKFKRSMRVSISRYSEETRSYCNRSYPRGGLESVGPHIDYRGMMCWPRLCGVMTDDDIAHTMSTDPSWQSKSRGCRLRVGLIEQETDDDDDDVDVEEVEQPVGEMPQPTWEERTIEGKSRKRADLTSVDPCICLDDNGVGIAFLLSLGLLIKRCSDGRVLQVVLEENAERTRVRIPPTWHQSNFITLAKVLSLIAIALERIEFLGVHQDIEEALEETRSKIQNELLISVAAKTDDAELEVAAPVLPFLPLDRLCGHSQRLTFDHFQQIVSRTVPYYAVAPRDKFHRASCGCLFPGGLAEIGKELAVPETKVIPQRFYDAHQSNASHLKDKIVTIPVDTPVDNYVALSYPWNSYDSDDLERIIATVDKVLNHRYYWVDRWCIDQESYEDKEREVPKMKDYYSNAECTLILPGVTLPTELAQLKADGTKVQLFKPELAQKVKEIWKDCQWTRRCWTLQEAYMSKECIFWTGQESAPLIHCSHLLGILHSSPFDNHYINALPYLPVDIGQFGETTLVGRSLAIAESTAESIYQRSIVRCAGHGTILDANAYQRPLAVLVDKIRGREATLELDEYYSLFSMASDKLPAVDYKIDTFQLLERIVNTGALGANLLLTNTGHGSGDKGSWVPRRCIQRDYSLMGTEINASQPTISDGAMIVIALPLELMTDDDGCDQFSAGAQISMIYIQPSMTGWMRELVVTGTISRKLKKAGSYLLLQPPNWGRSKFTSGLVLLATQEQQPGNHIVIDATIMDNMTQDKYLENGHLNQGQPFRLL